MEEVKKYKCVVGSYNSWNKNVIYSENSASCFNGKTVKGYARTNPDHWELVIVKVSIEEDYEVY